MTNSCSFSDLQLDPGAAPPARFVNRIGLLADDAFEPEALHLAQSSGPASRAELAGITHRVANSRRTTAAELLFDSLGEVRSDPFPRAGGDRRRSRRAAPFSLPSRGPGGAERKSAPSRRARRLRRRSRIRRRASCAIASAIFGEFFREVVFVPRDQLHLRALLEREDAEAIELQLVNPFPADRRRFDQLRLHWLDETRLGRREAP